MPFETHTAFELHYSKIVKDQLNLQVKVLKAHNSRTVNDNDMAFCRFVDKTPGNILVAAILAPVL